MKALKGGSGAVEDLETAFGEQVRSLRKSRAITQQQLAEAANISWGAIKNLEGGHGSSLRTLVRVLRALEAEDWLETLHSPSPTFNPLDVPAPKPILDRSK